MDLIKGECKGRLGLVIMHAYKTFKPVRNKFLLKTKVKTDALQYILEWKNSCSVESLSLTDKKSLADN